MCLTIIVIYPLSLNGRAVTHGVMRVLLNTIRLSVTASRAQTSQAPAAASVDVTVRITHHAVATLVSAPVYCLGGISGDVGREATDETASF